MEKYTIIIIIINYYYYYWLNFIISFNNKFNWINLFDKLIFIRIIFILLISHKF